MLDCQYGKHYYKEKSVVCSKRQRFQGTKKIGCQAKIKIKTFYLYPQYKLIVDTSKTHKERQQAQNSTIESLRAAVQKQSSDVHVQVKYWISLPSVHAHTGHPVGNEAGFSQRIHPLLTSKITEMVISGITSTSEVKRSLNFYATTVLAPQLGITFSKRNRAFNPTSTDVRNHIYIAKKSLELSKIDQENVRLKVEQFQKRDATSSFFFRPYIQQQADTQLDSSESTPKLSTKVQNCYNGNTGGDHEEIGIVGSSTNLQQSFLLVHQEQWQKELLAKYGNDISLVDATYKTTRYDIALFFICVKTNVGYTVVAEFVIQDETADKIEEAIQILKKWNPNWNPKFELLAIEKCFPNTKVFLCDFHREQAWERWVRDHKHGLQKDEQEELLTLLRASANAAPFHPQQMNISTESVAEQGEIDKLYNQAVMDLKSSSVWEKHDSVQQWLTTTWLCIPKVSYPLTHAYTHPQIS